jgi:ribosomal protein L40E
MQQPPTSGGAGGEPVTCQICGAANPPGAATCQTCHANLMSDSLRCQMCGGVSPPGSEACMVCGASLVQRSGPAADPAASAAPPTTDDEDGRRCACGALNPLAAPACIVCGTRLVGPIAYQLIGTLMPALEMSLEPGQGVYAQTHCLGWMTETVQMRTLARGSPWALLGRVASGMTMLVSHFRTPTTPGLVAFTPHLPGRIMPLELSPHRG